MNTADSRKGLKNTKRLVIKVGSALVTNDGSGLDLAAIEQWVKQIAELSHTGMEIILVSSGAVAEGLKRLGWNKRPKQLFDLQAAAAVGQMGLVQAYESGFRQFDRHTAQVLLTHEDLSNRTRYLNARSTILRLLELGTIPVVNENDTVVTEEIRFGDNDTLAALVANLIEADLLIILTDQLGMYNSDPRQNPQAELMHQVKASDPKLDSMASDSKGMLGRGGMATKLRAARVAARSGSSTIIASGREEKILCKLIQGEVHGTLFLPDDAPLVARKQWLAGHLQIKGTITLDQGAAKVLRHNGSSLLAIGISAISGNFERGDMVRCVDEQHNEIARGLVNYNAAEAQKIMRQPSHKIADILGYIDEEEFIHRDNLVLS